MFRNLIQEVQWKSDLNINLFLFIFGHSFCIIYPIYVIKVCLNINFVFADFHIGDNAIDVPSYSTKVSYSLREMFVSSDLNRP